MGAGLVAIASLAASTLVIALLRIAVHVTYPAPVYLLAVLAVGMLYGTLPAMLTSVVAFLLYDFLFVQPLYTLTVSSPDEWLNLLLLLAVAFAIGRLAALQAEKAKEAADRAREAEALHEITGVLAARPGVDDAAPAIVSRLAEITDMDRVWVALGNSPTDEKTLADSAPGQPVPVPLWQVVLQRSEDGGMRWTRVHVSGRRGRRVTLHRVRVEVAGEVLGSLWAIRAHGSREPDRAETRILSAAADQLGQAVVRDRLGREATNAEIARQSEALKTALLDSVSHDLRTPLATIRALAGSMVDPEVHWSTQEQRDAFEEIDREAERMGRLVRNLLDLSRIEAGAIKPELEPRELGELVRQAIERAKSSDRTIAVALPADLPMVLVDEVFLSQVLINLLENAARYGGQAIEVRARTTDDRLSVALSVEDDGEGVPNRSLGRLFDKFYQVPRAAGTTRRGMGIGLAVVAGLTRAMGGSVEARRSDLGGLAVVVQLPAIQLTDEPETEEAPAASGTADPAR